MANFSGIEMIETGDRHAARPTGFYSEGPAGRSVGRLALIACGGQNTPLSQKRLFSSDLETPHPSILDWRTLRGHAQGEPPGPDHL